MHTTHHSAAFDSRANIPLLDRGFDSKPPELDGFILAHSLAQDEGPYLMEFSKKTDRKSHEQRSK